MEHGKRICDFNPLAGNGNSEEDARLLQMILDEELEYYDMTRITNYSAFISGIEKEDYLVIVGGDGTLNRFANDTADIEIRQEILHTVVPYRNIPKKDYPSNIPKECAYENAGG